MYCKICGSEIDDNAGFCPVCGAEIIMENEEADGEGETTVLRANPEPSYTPVNQTENKVEYTPIGQTNANIYTNTSAFYPQKDITKPTNQMFENQLPAGDNYNSELSEMHLAEEAEEIKKTKKAKTGIIRNIILAVIAVCVVAAGALGSYYFLQGRSKAKTIKKYEQALNNNNKEDMLALMFPKEHREAGRNAFREGDVDLVTWSYNLREKDGSITLNLKDTTAVDEKDEALRADVEAVLLSDIGVSYDDMIVADLDVTCSKGDDDALSEVIMYQVGNMWYILPGCIQYVTEERQDSDIAQAKDIQEAINESLSDETVLEDMKNYHNFPISVENDLAYLPRSFVEAYNQNMGELQAFRYTQDGASGYSFSVDDRGNVSVYIASAKHIDEWQVVPSVADSYYNGTLREGEDGDRTFAYVKLISEKSPILGYWQSDQAGMYIGYNTSGGKEGFTVYLALRDYGNEIMHTLAGFQCSGGDGYILYTYNGTNSFHAQPEYKLVVNSDSSITLEASDVVEVSTSNIKNITLEFTKGELDKNAKMKFAGTWIGEGGDGRVYTGEFGNKKELILCDTCGYVHDMEMTNTISKDGFDYHKDAVVELFDGENLQYIFPEEGLSVVEGGQKMIAYRGDKYKLLEDGELTYVTYIENVSALNYIYAKNDSKKGAAIEAATAYKEFLAKDSNIPHLMAIGPYSLVYLDGDDTPELFTSSVDEEALGAIFTYRDGKVTYHELEWSNNDNGIVYYERGGKYWYSTYKDDVFILHGGELKNGSCTEYHVAACDESIFDEPQFYVGDNLSSQQDYENAVDNAYDESKAKPVYYYNSIDEAYEALGF